MCNWIRSELKQKAKAVLKTSYWKAFLVALIISFTGSGPNINMHYDFNANSHSENPFNVMGNVFGGTHFFFTISGAIIITVILLAVSFWVFLAGPLDVSCKKYYTRAALGEVNLGYIGFCFDTGRYMPIVRTMFFKNLYNFLWSLLLIAPGIVKSYSYRMVPYILGDNPTLNTERAITLSRELDGWKQIQCFCARFVFPWLVSSWDDPPLGSVSYL